jgi:TolA-binding protein
MLLAQNPPLSKGRRIELLIAVVAFLGAAGCSTAQSRGQQQEVAALKQQVSDLQAQVVALSPRLDSMESKLVALTPQPPKMAGVTAHPSEGIGRTISPPPSIGDPEPGFMNDEAVQDYRRGMLLYEAHKLSDAGVAFNSFLEKYPDHPFAGAALFYMGECSFGEKNYAKAYDEFQRVLMTYDRSSHVADTLRDLAEVEEQMHKSQDAARHRHLLTSLFPASPAIATVASAPATLPTSTAQTGSSLIMNETQPVKVEEIAADPGKKNAPKAQNAPAASTGDTQLDPPPTAPVERAPVERVLAPAQGAKKPGDLYPAGQAGDLKE